MKHTPGPWEVKETAGAGISIDGPIPFEANCVEYVIPQDKCWPLYQIKMPSPLIFNDLHTGWPDKIVQSLAYETFVQFEPQQWSDMQLANAHLIAAAPELFEACKYVVSELSEYLFPDTLEIVNQAISKAEGE